MINFPDSLYYKIKDKKCILFLGSGATVQSGGCFGEDLSRYIYGQINTEIKFSKDLAKYTQLLVGSGYREEIEKIIRKRFSKQKPSESFRKISSLPWKAIYTTNYDDLIEKSYEKQDYYQYVNEDIENPGYMYNDNDIPLYKLNGDIRKAFDEKHPLIITMTDLKKSKIANERIVSRLTDDLNDTFVFIGYSFQDKIITDILDCFMATPRWESIKEKYIVSPELSEDDELQLSIYNIKHIKASSDDFFDYLDNRSQSDYQIKLQRIKAMVTKNSPLSGLKPRTINNILECFEYYNPESLYPSDGKYFYRGGNADWGIIIKEYDISRKLKVVDLKTKTCTDYTSYDVHRIFSDIHNTGIKKVLLCGPAVSGKTTTLYRIAYNLIKENILCLVFKQQANYKRGILKDVNQQIHSGFVVFIDNLTINIGEIHKMIEEATENNIPITFCMATRFSEWQNSVNEFNKAKLEPVNYQVEMEDFIEEIECEKLLSKLSEINLVTISNKAEKSAMIKKFSTSKNLIKILLEIIDRSNISKSICSEYEDLSPEAKMAYGLVSQTYQYDLMIKWEVLRRAIEKKFIFEWDDFIKKIFKGDARGNLFEEFLQGNHFIRGRHRYISKFIIDIHYKGSFKNEKEDILSLISAVTENPYEERFIGSVLNAIISDDERNLTNNDCYEILDAAIDKFYNSKNIAFIIHLKGELFLKERLYKDALKCFDTNVQNKENLPHSLHSLGKTYFYLAQDKELNSGEFRNSINTALEKLFEGLELFRYNEFYYSMIISIFKYLKQHDKFSDLDRKREMKFEERAKIGIGIDKYKELLDAK